MSYSQAVPIIIPSAKGYSELKGLSNLVPVISPINNRLAFDYIYDHYSDRACEYKIIVDKTQGSHVREILQHHSAYKRIEIVELNNLKDLGYSVLMGLKSLQNAESCIIHLADTLMLDNSLDPTDIGDYVTYGMEYPNRDWTFFETKQGVVTHIIDKREQGLPFSHKQMFFTGVFGIACVIDFTAILQKTLKNPMLEMDSFYAALAEYSQTHSIQIISSDQWHDIGHAGKYDDTLLSVRARAFNHIHIDKERTILEKTSDNREKLVDEIAWYVKLPEPLQYVRPRVFSYSLNPSNPYVKMEYYSYMTLHELFLYGNLNYSQWHTIFERIRFILDDFACYSVSGPHISESLREMYFVKTLNRLNSLRETSHFAPFFMKPFRVNGCLYNSLNSICHILQGLVTELLENVSSFPIIHGDLCLSNILTDDNFQFIKLIDPRGRFGHFDIYGDRRYELAKILHSIEGKYDFIIKDMFQVVTNLSDATHSLELKVYKQNESDIPYQCFLDCFKQEIEGREKQITLIESLLFLSMIPLHSEKLDRQYAMLATGVQLLSRVADIYK